MMLNRYVYIILRHAHAADERFSRRCFYDAPLPLLHAPMPSASDAAAAFMPFSPAHTRLLISAVRELLERC